MATQNYPESKIRYIKNGHPKWQLYFFILTLVLFAFSARAWGRNPALPSLPTVPGDEGVGEVVEIGSKVCCISCGNRVVLTQRLLGTWRYYGIYNERALHRIPHKLPLAEASMLTIAPCTAYRMIKDFRNIEPGQTVIQNAANSPIGQCVIMICKALGIKTLNIVANHCGYEAVKEYLLGLGGNIVCTLEEAEEMSSFTTALTRPVLAFNCLGGRYEDVMLRLLEYNGTIVYYGCSYDLPMCKRGTRVDAQFHKFHYGEWCKTSNSIQRSEMLSRIMELMVVGKVQAPIYIPIQLKDYVHAFRNTVHCEAFATKNFVFDFTCP